MASALEGIRVLDLTVWQQGTYASAILADVGADVIKIEAPGQPDPGDHRRIVGLVHKRGKALRLLDVTEVGVHELPGPLPAGQANPTDGHLWIGADNDVILRERGIEFVDGTAPGFAACVGYCPTNDDAVRIVTR